jgi:hypothetical protein
MKYATWDLYFPDNGKYGYTADQEIVKRGFASSGITHIGEITIFGSFEEGADISGLEKYSFRELTTEEAESILTELANRQIISM